MKNASLILNAVLLVAVVVLFILHFSSGKNSGGASNGSSGPSNLKVAYVNQDTVLKYYEYVKTQGSALEAKANSFQQQLEGRQQGLQRELQAYQSNRANMTIGQIQAVEQDLQNKGQNLQMYQEQLSQQMMEERDKINTELYGKITDFLKQYSKEKGIEMILKYERGSDLLFAGDSLDISKDVIAGLNAAYKADGAKTTPAKTDTTKSKSK